MQIHVIDLAPGATKEHKREIANILAVLLADSIQRAKERNLDKPLKLVKGEKT